jgi:putative membrane protein
MRSIFAVTILAAGVVCAQSLSRTDESFLKKASEGNTAEVKMGELAKTNAANDAVKKFGERMVTDHSKMYVQVKSLAAAENVSLPGDMSMKDRVEYKRLEDKHGADFDKAYIDLMIRDHKADIAEFQKEASSGASADVKSLASDALPTLQDHLKMAQDAATKIGIGSTTGGMR